MKIYNFIFFFLLHLFSFGQSAKYYEQKLNQLAEKRENCAADERRHSDIQFTDSLEKSNIEFEDYLLKVTSTIPESLECKFATLKEESIGIYTSDDGSFRIYSWDTYEGGTMHFFRNILQHKVDGKVYSKLYNSDKDDSGIDFYELNQITSKGKNYYIANSIGVFSSANYYYEAKVFSIDQEKLNENAKLIKTKSGMQSSIGYEVDLSNMANRIDSTFYDKRDYIKLEYDKRNNIIILPLLNEDEKITKKKIRYKFNGSYFEKIKN